VVKPRLREWEAQKPGRFDPIAKTLGDIRASQMADPNLFDFLSLGKRGDSALPDSHAWLAGDNSATE